MATVNENANQPAEGAEGDINGASAVAIEASVINQSISQVVRFALRNHSSCGCGAAVWSERQSERTVQHNARFTASRPHLPWGGHEDTFNWATTDLTADPMLPSHTLAPLGGDSCGRAGAT